MMPPTRRSGRTDEGTVPSSDEYRENYRRARAAIAARERNGVGVREPTAPTMLGLTLDELLCTTCATRRCECLGGEQE